MKISVLVLTFNNADIIDRCLSALDFADELIVIDSFSKDDTVEKCKKHNVILIQKEYKNYIKQVEFGISKCNNDLILLIDSDEVVTEELKNEILESKKIFLNDNFSGAYINRRVFFLNRFINFGKWYPDYQFRYFHKDRIKFEYKEIHSAVHPKMETVRLRNDLIHYTYTNIFDYLERINKYTSLEVTNLIQSGKVFKKRKLFLNPASEFIRMFFVNKGFKDGMPGFTLASLSAIYKFISYLKYWEFIMNKDAGTNLPPITNDDFRNKFNKV